MYITANINNTFLCTYNVPSLMRSHHCMTILSAAKLMDYFQWINCLTACSSYWDASPCTHWSLRLCRGIKGAWQHSFLGGYRCKYTHSQTSKNTHLFSQWGLRTQLPLCDEWKKDAQQGKGRWKNDRWEEGGGKWCMRSCDVFNLEYGIIRVKGGRPVYECMLQEWNNESGGMWQKEGTGD